MGKTLHNVQEASKDMTIISGLTALGLELIGAGIAASLVANFLTLPGALVRGATSIANRPSKQSA